MRMAAKKDEMRMIKEQDGVKKVFITTAFLFFYFDVHPR